MLLSTLCVPQVSAFGVKNVRVINTIFRDGVCGNAVYGCGMALYGDKNSRLDMTDIIFSNFTTTANGGILASPD
tara:strand:- start:750 stop:971 length:222 start_codon:yes stop_codon:yes gene_type:complete